MKQFAIFDWAGNRLLPNETWNDFEDAWDAIYERFRDNDVVETTITMGLTEFD